MSLPCKRLRVMFMGVALCLGLQAAHADKLDDDPQTVWESLWDQRGTPQPLLRWEQPITYRIHGQELALHRQHIEKALKAATEMAQLQILDVSQASDPAMTVMLDLEVVSDAELEDNQPCVTQYLAHTGGTLREVRVKMRAGNVWRCAFHEMMHAMGVIGHPSGKTVLSYFPYRRDVLMDLDKLMLDARYSPFMHANSTPLEALVVLSQFVAKQEDLAVEPSVATKRARAFNLKKLREMQAMATGDGEVPTIILRSGRASERFIQSAKPMAAHFVGMAYFRGTIVSKNLATSSIWFKQGAEGGFLPAQIMWGYLLANGAGVEVDLQAGHAWMTLASKSVPSVADVLLQIEKKMGAEELESARAQPLPTVTPP